MSCVLLASYLTLARGRAFEEPGLYLTTAGACGLVAAAFDAVGGLRGLRTAVTVVLVALVAASGLGSSARCAVWKDAERVWLEVLDKYPNHERAQKKLAEHYRDVGLSEKAAALVAPQGADSFSMAVQLNNEGVALMDGKRLRGAAEKFKEATQLWPDFRDAHFNLGVVYQSMAELDSAEVSFRRTLEADPSYANAHYNLGIVYDQMSDYGSAEVEYRDAVTLDPSHARAWANLGAQEGRNNRFQEAIPLLERALEIEPGLLQARLNLAFAYEKVDMERAKEQWKIYLDLARTRGVDPDRIAQIERRLQDL
jgi:tetratricopeptide (TPR) repeat protein